MELEVVKLNIPKDANIIVGQTHFIKSVEDIGEAVASAVPGVKWGLAFNEASGARLIRYAGNDDELIEVAKENASKIGAGHTFVLIMRDAYPINIMPHLKRVPEICQIFAATANPLEVIVVRTEQGRGVLGVVDGFTPIGVEDDTEIAKRKQLLRKIGYKF
ncbi:adenosine monophosphate-protein transferase [candidate division bacterium WOR-3 4484_18]|uniref:Adenosine monophosphate-protein transferase n=1 Tax=candidate division WOR-3 bacterium 4484_18 TaxID=2020626 RepID=A0A257LUU9_UNCW3|nr:MAG: adenosine monophosphate-protein transferase [candidate division bacterium WOR-3 4484_18]